MKRILVVDDNLTTLKQISAQISEHYDVIVSNHGKHVLRICMVERPDLILLDVEMPEMSGFEVISQLKYIPCLRDIPVIFLTAHHDVDVEVEALQSGAVDFITKPFEKRILLHRIDLHIRMDEYQTHLQNSVMELSDNLAFLFAGLIECRDENTGYHVLRTSKYVDLIGRELINRNVFPELTEDALKMMVRAAPLHDIGKIAVSDRILLKPDRLTYEEFNDMKRHATVGGEILNNMHRRTPSQSYLHYAKNIAGFHHERFDGKGYPHGVGQENIPLCARIMAVADVYDALIENRVYRKAMSHKEAYDIIIEGRGSQFDPRVVDVFSLCEKEIVELAVLLPAS
ncbi:MAG: response regulator [Acidaminococcales bacterium]|jgi:putative two-component system response regulator|nr:response regulator [Acidaminococcales bacterium]